MCNQPLSALVPTPMPTGQQEGPQNREVRVVEMMGNKFQTWSYVSFTGKAQSQLDMGH